MRKSNVWLVAVTVSALGWSLGCGPSRDEEPTGPSEVLSTDAAPPIAEERTESGDVRSNLIVVVGKTPVRPVSGTATLGYGERVGWSAKPHNGIDYSARVGTPILAVGSGTVYAYTKATASRFGSISPDGAGPAVWIRHTVQDGSPIYVLYGHTATSWTDYSTRSTVNGKAVFTFSCTYTVPSLRSVAAGETIGYTAPFYNGGALKPHLHLSVFKPARLSNGQFSAPPASGWGYSDVVTTQGQYVDPELFLRSYKLR